MTPLSPLNPLAVVVAELGIIVLGVFALVEGLDGAIFVTSIAALAGLGGYQVKQMRGPPNGKT